MKRVSGRQMVRVLEQRGWVVVRTKGSHHRLEKPGFPPVTVPVHGNRTLKPGTQRGIMQTAGLTDDDL
jgi:predicted RNA binding protein YcfA (HicA-like mRNA interferase family)